MEGLLLLSGGIDSPVAGKLMQERGVEVAAIHFSLEPFTDDLAEQKSRKVAEKLGISKCYVVRHGNQHAEIVNKADHKFYYILTRRLMYRVAEAIAKRDGYAMLITGENLGQVGSQTLSNMSVIDSAVSLPVLRPVLGLDKVEIIRKAKAFDTYELSIGPEVCDTLGPKHPATSSTNTLIAGLEKNYDWATMVKEAVAQAEE